MHTKRRLAFSALIALLAGCSGGGSGAPSLAPAAPGGAPAPIPAGAAPSPSATGSVAATARGTLSFTIPPKGATVPKVSWFTRTGGRTPQYLSPSTLSVQLSVMSASGASAGGGVYNVGANSPYCTAATGGGFACNVPFNAAPGNDTLVVTTYDSPNAFGGLLSYAKITQTIAAQTANPIAITLLGEPSALVFTPVPGGFTYGKAETRQLQTLVADADGNLISGTFDAPLQLTLIGDTADFSLSESSMTTNDGGPMITYNGNPSAGAVEVIGTFTSPTQTGYDGKPLTNTITSVDLSGFNRTYTAGDQYSYTTTTTEQDTYPGSTPSPATINTSLSTVTVVSTSASYNGKSNLTDVRFVSMPTPGPSGTPIASTSDSYYGSADAVAPYSSTSIIDYGYTYAYKTKSVVDTVNFTFDGNLVSDTMPEVPGTALTENIAQTSHESITSPTISGYYDLIDFTVDAVGGTQQHTRYNDPRFPITYDDLITVDDAGNAKEVFTQSGYTPETYTYGQPTMTANGYVIPTTDVGGDATGSTPAPQRNYSVPDWLPGGGAFPLPLSGETVNVIAPASVPQSCGASAGKPASDWHFVNTQLSPFGFVDVVTSDRYSIQGMGEVCLVSSETAKEYDALMTGALTGTFVIQTVKTLTSETISSLARRPQSVATAVTSALAASMDGEQRRESSRRIQRMFAERHRAKMK